MQRADHNASHVVAGAQVTQMVMTGSWGEGLTRDALELAMGGCTQLKALMREALLAPT